MHLDRRRRWPPPSRNARAPLAERVEAQSLPRSAESRAERAQIPIDDGRADRL